MIYCTCTAFAQIETSTLTHLTKNFSSIFEKHFHNPKHIRIFVLVINYKTIKNMRDSIELRKRMLEAAGFTMIDCVEGLEGMYGINENGDIFSIRRMGLLKRCKHSLGYEQVYLSNLLNNGGRWYKLHRLVGMQFIPNPDNLPDINHKDGIKSNNKKTNLEWMSHSDNIKHSYVVLGRKHDSSKTYKKVKCSNGKEYESLKAASLDTGCKIPNISACLNGKIKHTKKLVFSFL